MDAEDHQDSPEPSRRPRRDDTPHRSVDHPPVSSTTGTPATATGSVATGSAADDLVPGNLSDGNYNLDDDQDLPPALISMSQSLRNSQGARHPVVNQDDQPDPRHASTVGPFLPAVEVIQNIAGLSDPF